MIETTKRPVTLVIGCVMAWVGGGLGLIGGIILGALPADADFFTKRFDDPAAAASVVHTVGYLYAAWSLAVIVVAVFAFLGRRWAALTLVVMAAVILVLTLISALRGPSTGIISGIWSAVSAALVYRRPVSSEISA